MAKKIDGYCLESVDGLESFVSCAVCGESMFFDGYGFAPLRKDIINKTLEELEKTNRVRKCARCIHLVIICTACLQYDEDEGGWVSDSNRPLCSCCLTLMRRCDVADIISFLDNG